LRQRPLARKVDRGESSAVETLGCFVLRDGAHTRRREQKRGNAYGEPPASTVLSTSAQRFPHGLNLFAS
jgi:hypothetical protein